MRETGRMVASMLDAVEAACVPGVSTWELDRIAARELSRAERVGVPGLRAGGAPPYPAVLCTSVNHVVVHGIPTQRRARRGRHHRHRLRLLQGRLLRRRRPHRGGRRDQRARAPLLDVTTARRWSGPSPLHARTGWRTSAPPSRATPSRTGTRSCASWSGTASAGRCTRRREVRTTASPGAGLRLRPGMVIAIEPMVNAGGRGPLRWRRVDRRHRGRRAVRPLRAHRRHHRGGAPVLTAA